VRTSAWASEPHLELFLLLLSVLRLHVGIVGSILVLIKLFRLRLLIIENAFVLTGHHLLLLLRQKPVSKLVRVC
jgi:hypothetical protein